MNLTVKKCLQAWTNTLKQMNVKADIVFFGDSLTYYGDFTSVFPDKVVCNLGLRGDTISGMIDRIEQVRVLEPKKVYLMAGINDVSNLLAEVFAKAYMELLVSLKSALPNTELIIQSIIPVNSSSYDVSCDNRRVCDCNKIIRHIAECEQQTFIDTYSVYVLNDQLPETDTLDGIHLTIEAYNKWYELIKGKMI